MSKKIKDLNLEALIGAISQKQAKNLSKSVIINETTQTNKSEKINGLLIETKVNKLLESFRIKQHLKLVVESVVKEAKNLGHNVSKGHIYNLLIEVGLKTLKKD